MTKSEVTQADNRSIAYYWKAFRSNPWLSWPADIFLYAVILYGVYSWQTGHLIKADGTEPVPAFTAQTISGEFISSENFSGKKSLVYFFATWCAACNMSMSNLNALHRRAESGELAVYLVALSYETKQEIEEYVARHELNMPVILGTPQMARDFRIESFPTYYVINEEGKIISRDVGYSTRTGLLWRSGELGI